MMRVENIENIITVYESIQKEISKKIKDLRERYSSRPEIVAFRDLEEKVRERAVQMMKDGTTGNKDTDHTHMKDDTYLLDSFISTIDIEDDKVEVVIKIGSGYCPPDYYPFDFPIAWLSDEVYDGIVREKTEKEAEKRKKEQEEKEKKELQTYRELKEKYEGE